MMCLVEAVCILQVLTVAELKGRQPPYGELDFVGIVVNIKNTGPDSAASR